MHKEQGHRSSNQSWKRLVFVRSKSISKLKGKRSQKFLALQESKSGRTLQF